MRKYTLASKEAKEGIDLRDYRKIIEEAVHEVLPNATVQVQSDYYIVSPTPKQGDAVRIGRAICKSELKQYCVQIPKLFSSIELEEEKDDGGTKEKRPGGHH